MDEDEHTENNISDKICNGENNNADNGGNNDGKELYAEVQMNCEDFRNNVFFKTGEQLEENMGKFDTKPQQYKPVQEYENVTYTENNENENEAEIKKLIEDMKPKNLNKNNTNKS